MRFATLLILGLVLVPPVHAGPPFFTDDPVPVDLHHWEAYIFATGDRTADGNSVNGPATEWNYGLFPDTQVHLVVPVANVSPSGGTATSGLGDVELGVKYRFIHEGADTPQVGVFPMIELPTGSARRGLGNGRVWYRVPVWLQKSWGPWTSFGGGGYVLNSAPGQRNYPFAGWLVQRDFGPHLTLGAEVFSQGADTVDGRGFTGFNVGGYLNFTENFSILFSGGHSIHGEGHTMWYLALYWTWGPAAPVQG